VTDISIAESRPSLEEWLADIKRGPDAARIGMYLIHNGVVRGTSRDGSPVSAMQLTYDRDRLRTALAEIGSRPGLVAVRAWVNEGRLDVGDDIMMVVVAGDIREHVIGALQDLVRLIKTEVVKETELA